LFGEEHTFEPYPAAAKKAKPRGRARGGA
jgi:hypothetical protein